MSSHNRDVPTFGSFAAFAAMAFALIVVPGPSVLFVVSRGVALGHRAVLATVSGNAIGQYVQVLLVACGVGAIVERSIVVFNVVKLCGAAYLVWLGIQAVRHRRRFSTATEATDVMRSRRSLLLDGFVVGVANPKSIVFFAAILPQFVVAGGAPAPLQMLLLGVVWVAVALVSDTAWGLCAGTARNWFMRAPHRMQRIGAAGGIVMIGLGVRLALSGRHD